MKEIAPEPEPPVVTRAKVVLNGEVVDAMTNGEVGWTSELEMVKRSAEEVDVR
jgi:hypothetical protein